MPLPQVKADFWDVANFVIIGLIVGGIFAYVVFQQRQGKPIVAGKKRA